MLKIIHGADFHLDSPFSGLTPERAAQRRGEQRELLGRLADLARERRAFHSDSALPAAGSAAEGGTLDEIILNAVHQTLDAAGGNQTLAAKRLGISRTTLWRYLNPRDSGKSKKDPT